MPANLGTSILSIGTDDRPLEKGLDTAESKAKAFVNRLKSILGGISMAALGTAISGGMNVATGAAEKLIDGLGKVGLALQGLKSIGDTIQGTIGFLTSGNAALEMVTISFTTLLGSASGAADMIKQLTDFAASTPFELTGLEANTQKLLAFGFGAEEIIPLMTSMGDAIAALGGTQDNLNSLVYVMGQMRGEAHINAGDIMQMVNLGIPALQMLAEHYHVTTSEAKDMISKGLIPGGEAVKIFSDGLENRFGGMMAAQSSTFTGMISNLHDWAAQTMIVLTKPFFEPAKKGLQALLNFVQSPAGEAAVNKLAGFIQNAVDKATVAITQAIPAIKALWANVEPLAAAFWKFHNAINPISIALAVLQGYLSGGVNGALAVLKERFMLIAGYLKKGLDFAILEAKRYGPLILEWAAGVAFQLVQQALWWGRALVNWVLPYIPIVLGHLMELAGSIIGWIVQEAPILGQNILLWASMLVNWVLPIIPVLLAALVNLGLQVLGWIEREAPLIVVSLLAWTSALAGWIIPAIPGVISSLVQLSRTVLAWAITNIPNMLAAIVVAVGTGLSMNLRRPVNDLLAIFRALVSTIRTYIVPAFFEMAGIIQAQLFPILDRVTGIIVNAVLPTLGALAAFLMTTGVSAFLTLADALLTFLQPVLIAIGDVIRNDLLPLLSTLWVWFDTNYMPTIRNLAALFGEKLAGGIELVGAKLRDSAPAIENFISKFAPFATKVFELYQALSPVNIAFDVLMGFLTGGLPGAWQALEDHVIKAGNVFGVNLKPAMDTITDTVLNHIIPALSSFWQTLTTDVLPNVLPAIGSIIQKFIEFGDWVSVNIWPRLQSVFNWIVANIGPIFRSMAETISQTVIPALQRFFTWVGETLWPKLKEVFAWVDTNVRPVLEKAFKIIGENIIPTIGDFIALVLDHLIPVLSDWWSIIATYLKPIFEELLKVLNENVLPALKDIWEFIQKKGIPAFAALADFIRINVFPILRTIGDILGNTVGKAIGFVIDRIKNLIDFWNVVITIGDKLLHGDIGGAIGYAVGQLQTLFKGQDINISASGTGSGGDNAENNAAQVRLQQYMMNHPNYNPNTAGNSYANGTLDARGGPSLVGEGGIPELVRYLSGQSFVVTKPTFIDLPRHAQVLPLNLGVSNSFGSLNVGRPNVATTVSNSTKKTELHLHQTVTPEQATKSAKSFGTLSLLYS
jgi:tape measure domain-containing protein